MRNFEIIERHIDRDVRNLHPIAQDAFRELAIDLENEFKRQKTKTHFKLFEGYRSPQRQRYLFGQKPQVTKSNAYQSAHNYGLACDFVAWHFEDTSYRWSWDDNHDWRFLKERAAVFGLHVPIEWDRGHVEHQAWRDHRWTLMNM